MNKDSLNNKCPSCNASIKWNPKEKKFKCEYCASTFTDEEVKEYNKKNLKEENSSSKEENKANSPTKDDNLTVYRCKNCGAEIIADENTISTFCLYCGSTAILKQKLEDGEFPDYVIPFTKTEQDAKASYQKLLENKIFLPKTFKDEKNIEKIRGLYVPFWAYDIESNGNIEFDCEDTRRWEDDEYEYEEIKEYHVVIDGHYEFEKILCDASKNIEDDLMDSIAPFSFQEMKVYDHVFLSGYLADKYDISSKELYERAEERAKNSSISEASRITGHDSESYRKDNLAFKNKKTYYIYLPVYILNTKWNDKMYTFAMNGQTGKLIGNLPMDKAKFVIAIIIVFGLSLFAVSFILSMFM